MAKSSFYPKANRTAQWWEKEFQRGYFTKIEKILLHTTETASWPSYNQSGKNGDAAPTLTYKPATREWRQHNYLDTSARALGDPASTPVRENRDNVIQIEIIWYASKIDQLPATAYVDLAEFVAYVRKEWGGPSLTAAKFVGASAAPKVHMSSSTFDSFNGILGHQHAPSPSTHWDPGAFDGARLLDAIRKIEAPVVTPPPSKPTPPAGTVQAPDIANPSVKQIMEWDGIAAPNAAETDPNKFWTLASYIRWGYKQGTQILDNQKKIIDLLNQINTKLQG